MKPPGKLQNGIDVHGRDMIDKFIQLKLQDQSAFQWQSQLRFYWGMKPPGKLQNGIDLVSVTDDTKKTCIIKICDWVTLYLFEYVGNCGRLVITPLTDRCYITLSQACNLILGGAPAGPAGTGKTETTKDLSRAIGLPIMVFNCSDQMSYLTMANIFMGLSQTGAWGCFDEFNRIGIEVLSVVSTQYKTVLDAIRANVKQFLFMDEEIKLVSTIGSYITMNPGYAGRTELPENLKALFRPCAMVVPDLVFICENMLMSEGFVVARAGEQVRVLVHALPRAALEADALRLGSPRREVTAPPGGQAQARRPGHGRVPDSDARPARLQHAEDHDRRHAHLPAPDPGLVPRGGGGDEAGQGPREEGARSRRDPGDRAPAG